MRIWITRDIFPHTYRGIFMKNVLNRIGIVALCLLLTTLLSGLTVGSDCQGGYDCNGAYEVNIEDNSTPHSSSVVVGAGESVDMRVVVLNVTEPSVAGSDLYLVYDPAIVSDISCVYSPYTDANTCGEVEPGRYRFMGYDTFGNFTGDVIVAVLNLTANSSALYNSSTDLVVTGPLPGQAIGTPVWGPGWMEINTIFNNGSLTVDDCTPIVYIEKTANPDEGSPSTDINFTITVRNSGTCMLDPVVVIDTLPQKMSYVSSSPTGTVDNNTVTWSIGPLDPGSSDVTLYLVAHIDQGASGVLQNEASVIGTPPVGDDVNSSAAQDVTVLLPEITVTKAADLDEGSPSTDVVFAINVTNTGSFILDPVIVVDTLPQGMSYVSSNPAGTVDNNTVTWSVGPLMFESPPVNLQLVAHIDQGASGVLQNVATATGTPPTGEDVTSTALQNVTVLIQRIEVTKTSDIDEGAPSANVTFTIDVANIGEALLDPVEVVDTLPEGMSYVSSDPVGTVVDNTVRWSVGPLASGSFVHISLVAHIDSGASGVLQNQVVATGAPSTGDSVTAEAIWNITTLDPGIEVLKTADSEVAYPGKNITFTIGVSNTGDCDLDPVTIVDTLPEGMTYISDDSGGVVDGNVVTWNLGLIGSGDLRNVSLVAKVNRGIAGTLVNEVAATGRPSAGDPVTDTDFASVVSENVVILNIQETRMGTQGAFTFGKSGATNSINIIEASG